MKAVRFDWVDFIIKKTAHIVEYMVLFVLLFRAIEGKVRREWAYILGIVYAFFDETHQLFSPGRTGMLRDILIFDNLGLLVGWVVSKKYKFIDKWWKK